jgi:hypothetical protein
VRASFALHHRLTDALGGAGAYGFRTVHTEVVIGVEFVIQILKKVSHVGERSEDPPPIGLGRYLTEDQMITEKSKHIDIRYHFVCDIIEKGLVKVCKISTHDNFTNTMTKHVSVAMLKLSWY